MQKSYGTHRKIRQRVYALTLFVWVVLIAFSLLDWSALPSLKLPYLLQGSAWIGVEWFAPLLAIFVGLVGVQSVFRLQILDSREVYFLPLALTPMATLWLSGATASDYLTLLVAPLLVHVALRQPSEGGKPIEALYLGLIVGGLSLFSAQALWLFVPLMGGMMCMRVHPLRPPLAFLLGGASVISIAFPVLVLSQPIEIEEIIRGWWGGFYSPLLGGEAIWAEIVGRWTLVAWASVGLIATLWGWEGIRHLGTLQRNRAIAVQVMTLLLIPLCLISEALSSPLSMLLAYTLSVSVARALGSLSPRVEPYVTYSFAFVWLLLSLLP